MTIYDSKSFACQWSLQIPGLPCRYWNSINSRGSPETCISTGLLQDSDASGLQNSLGEKHVVTKILDLNVDPGPWGRERMWIWEGGSQNQLPKVLLHLCGFYRIFEQNFCKLINSAALGVWVCTQALSSCSKQGLLSSLQGQGFSRWRLLLLQSMGSRVRALQYLWHVAQ